MKKYKFIYLTFAIFLIVFFKKYDFTFNFLENKNTQELYFEKLDYLGRSSKASGIISKDMFPKKYEKRESIKDIRPSGFNVYIFKGENNNENIYNRCHLIAWILSKENANPKNLFTCTRQANYMGMLPYEKKIKNYIIKTGNRVYYAVEAIYEKDELVARKIHMYAKSVESNDLIFDVYIDNVQDGFEINYLTGKIVKINE